MPTTQATTQPPESIESETARLLATLSAAEISVFDVERRFPQFSDASKNRLVADLAHRDQPFLPTPPDPGLLSCLPYVVTSNNKADMIKVFAANLASPLPLARKASLQGLATLEDPRATDFALRALEDKSDTVVAGAAYMLWAAVERDTRIRPALRATYRAHVTRTDFPESQQLLRAWGMDRP